MRLSLLLIIAAASAWFPAAAGAFDLFGVHLFGETTSEAPSPDAQPYTITFTLTGGDGRLDDALRGASTLWTGREGKPPPSSGVFLSIAQGEYGRLVAALRNGGYYGGSVVIRVDGRPLESYRPDATLPKPVAVEIAIAAGPVFQFGAVSVIGRPPAEPEEDPRIATPEGLGLVEGRVAFADVVLKSEIALLNGWRRQGHPKATLLPRTLLARHDASRLDVTIGVDPGPAARFGEVRVKGTQKMDREFVARQTAIEPGETWDKSRVEEAEKRLRRLQVFSSARLIEDKSIAPDGSLGLTTEVAERPLHGIGADASYSTLDGIGIGGFWEHRNLWGQAERLRLDGRVSGIDSADPTKFTYLASVTLVKPGILDPYTDLTVQVLGNREVYTTFTQDTARFRVGLAHQFSERLTGSISLNTEYDRVDDAFGLRDLVFNSIPAELIWDNTDNKLEPTRGYRVRLTTEPFYEANRGNAGAIFKAQGSTYYGLDADGKYVLAGRLALGSIAGAAAYELPADRLFFAGGGQSVRGYRYLSLGPTRADGAIQGGRSLAEASLELRLKVTDTIGVVPFVDAGNAFAASVPDFSSHLKVGAGIGLRYYTSLGAIRLDVAAPVNRGPGDPRFALYLGLGESF